MNMKSNKNKKNKKNTNNKRNRTKQKSGNDAFTKNAVFDDGKTACASLPEM